MSCSPTDRIMQSLRVHTPGATDEMLQLELFNVIDEFLRSTNAWRIEEEVELEENQREYAFGLPQDSIVVRSMGVMHNGVPVPASTQGGVTTSSLGALVPELTFPDGDSTFGPQLTDKTPDNLFTYAIYRPNYIQVTADADAEARKYPLRVSLALSISPGCLECECGDWQLPDWMYETYFGAWYDGTLGRLYGMPAKPWSSDKHAVFHGRRFRNHMAFRRQEAQRGFMYNVQTWRFPRATR